jgi:hypothetical protein
MIGAILVVGLSLIPRSSLEELTCNRTLAQPHRAFLFPPLQKFRRSWWVLFHQPRHETLNRHLFLNHTPMSEITIDNSTERDELTDLLESVPDHLRNDPVALIFRCKYSYRDRLKESFNATQQQEVESELKRVEKLRSSFATHVENADLVQSMKFSRRAWRSHAKARCRDEMARIKKLLDKDKSKPNDRYRRDLKTLQEVGTWTTAIIDPIHSDTPVEEEEDYGLTTYKITLRKNLGTLSYNTYDLDEYPLHEVLYKKENNPLMEPCRENTIRYYHFPGNDMLWVEESRLLKSFYLALILFLGGNKPVLWRGQRRIQLSESEGLP